MYETAKEHAVKSGRKVSVGHDNIDSRYNKVKAKHPEFPDNCDHGNDNALDIIMKLLIDEGIPSLGYRNNILDSNMKYLGVSIQPHENYGTNRVMDFGG